MKLRPYQETALEMLSEKYSEGARSLILWAPTGAGKTVMAGSAIKSAIHKGQFVLFMAHRKELIDQCARKIDDLGLPYGIIMAGYEPDSTAPIQIASIQTLARREMPFAPDMIIADECHHFVSKTYRKIIEDYPEARVLGLTATPFRADGKGLGELFQDWVLASSVADLTENGYLAPARYWAPTMPDLAGIGKKAGDFDNSELAERLGKPKLIGDIINHYKSIAPGRKAIVFCVNKEHSQNVAQAFNDAGIKAAHLGDDTSKGKRTEILSDHLLGRLTVLTNVNILSEGYDSPTVEVCILARPTLSLGLHVQQIGRVLRVHPTKKCAFIIDHAGNVRRHGLATDPLSVDLSIGETKSREKKDEAPALRTCSRCYAILPASMRECPNCESKLGSPPKTIINKDGTLQELTKEVCECGSFTLKKEPHPIYGYCLCCTECGNFIRALGRETDPEEFYRKKLQFAREKGYKDSWAGVQFKVRFNRWPTRAESQSSLQSPSSSQSPSAGL